MTKIIDKIVVSSTAPKEKNVLWVDDDSINIPSKGKWKKASGGGSGSSGIDIVESVDKLDKNAPVGSMASVVTPGSIQETSFRDLYQPDESILDMNTGSLTAPELLSSVSSVSVFAPQNTDGIVESMIYLVTRDFSMTNQAMAMVQIVPQQGVMAITIIGGYDTMQQFMLAEYSQDTMSYTIHNEQVEAFNAVLGNGMDWCYLSNPETAYTITEEQFATIDLFIKAVAGVPSIADIYIKGDKWEQLYKKNLDKLASDLDKTKTTVEGKSDKITIATYSSWKGLQPNVYTTYSISSTGSVTVNLAAIADTTIYNEYILELKCTKTPSSVAFNNEDGTAANIVWANNAAPTFVGGFTYIISIVNNFGVFSQFTNE